MWAVRSALRTLSRSAAFTVTAVATLAIGIGLCATAYGVVDTLIHPPMPYRSPNDLYFVNWVLDRSRTAIDQRDIYGALSEIRSLDLAETMSDGSVAVQAGDKVREVGVLRVGPAYFELTGLRPWLGRTLAASDQNLNAAMISSDVWNEIELPNRHLGASLSVDDGICTIVGVMPEGAPSATIWVPLASPVRSRYGQPASRPVARLRPMHNRREAEFELSSLGKRLTTRVATPDAPIHFSLNPVVGLKQELQDLHLALVGGALLVFVIISLNLAQVVYARACDRRKSIAVRMTLGATGWQATKDICYEALLVAMAGGFVGCLLSVWISSLVRHEVAGSIGWVGTLRPHVSWRVLVAAIATSAVGSVMSAAWPAIRVARSVGIDEALKDVAVVTSKRGMRRSLLAMAQVAIALILSMAGVLMVRSLLVLRSSHYSFDASRLLVVHLGLGTAKVPPTRDWQGSIRANLLAIPGVEDVAFEGIRSSTGAAITAELTSADSTRTITARTYRVVSSNYLAVHRLRMLSGRDLLPGDVSGPSVAIISDEAAARLYPSESAVGHMLKLGAPATRASWVAIVGVFASPTVVDDDNAEPAAPLIAVSGVENVGGAGRILVHTRSASPKIAIDIRQRLWEFPGVWSVGVEGYGDGRATDIASRSYLMAVLLAMSGIAVVTSMLGIYGLLAATADQHMREFAIRVALGARPSWLLHEVLRHGCTILLGGLAAGSLAALLAENALKSALVGVVPTDVASLIIAESVLLFCGVLVGVSAARRWRQADFTALLRSM